MCVCVCIPQSANIIGASPSDYLVSYIQDTCWGDVILCRDAVSIFYNPSRWSSHHLYRGVGEYIYIIFEKRTDSEKTDIFFYYCHEFLWNFSDLENSQNIKIYKISKNFVFKVKESSLGQRYFLKKFLFM